MNLVGILNITPDSFSDGGEYDSLEKIIIQVKKLIADGAAVIDIGAESTRPGAVPIDTSEEWSRLQGFLPEIISVCQAENILTSIDTRHALTAQKALKLGVDWINDVTGFNADMIDAIRESGCKLVVMHNLGVPVGKLIPADQDPVAVVMEWAENKISALLAAGINKDRIIFDPGIGFGKNAAQSLEIINRIGELKKLDVPIYTGHSRKSFIGLGKDASIAEKDAHTLEYSQEMVANGVGYLRVHNVGLHKHLTVYKTPINIIEKNNGIHAALAKTAR